MNFPSETLKTLDKLAAREHTTTSELIRNFVEEGLKVNGYEEQVDFIARIIRQEITAVYHVEDIKAISDHSTDRLAKMLMKTGKINAAMFFLLVFFAALTSSISLLETVVSILTDKMRLTRKKATILSTAGILILGIPSCLGYGATLQY